MSKDSNNGPKAAPSAYDHFVAATRSAVGIGEQTPGARNSNEPTAFERLAESARQHTGIGDASIGEAAAPDLKPPTNFERLVAGVEQAISPEGRERMGSAFTKMADRSTGWVASQVRTAMDNLVGRVLLGETTTPTVAEHEIDQNKGIDR